MEWWIGGLFVVLLAILWMAARAARDPKPSAQLLDDSQPSIDPIAPLGDVPVSSEVALANPIRERIMAAAAAVDAFVQEVDGDMFFSKIAGVSKRNRSGPSRQKLLEELEDWSELYLFREPENRHSDFAIRIENLDGEQLGYIPDNTACRVIAEMDAGESYRCFVSEVTGWDMPLRGCNIALVHWSPERANRPEREFERMMDRMRDAGGGRWFYAKMVGLTKKNEDGTPRRLLYGALTTREQLTLAPDTDDSESATTVYVTNAEGNRLGALNKAQSAKVLAGFVEGRVWFALYRDCTEQEAEPGFYPNIAILCLSIEESARAKAKGGIWP